MRILIVEDTILIRLMICDGFRNRRDALVISAAPADGVLDCLVAENRSVVLALTDHLMPGTLWGAQLAARVWVRFPDIRAVVTLGMFGGPECNGPVLHKPHVRDETVAVLVKDARLARGEM